MEKPTRKVILATNTFPPHDDLEKSGSEKSDGYVHYSAPTVEKLRLILESLGSDVIVAPYERESFAAHLEQAISSGVPISGVIDCFELDQPVWL